MAHQPKNLVQQNIGITLAPAAPGGAQAPAPAPSSQAQSQAQGAQQHNDGARPRSLPLPTIGIVVGVMDGNQSNFGNSGTSTTSTASAAAAGADASPHQQAQTRTAYGPPYGAFPFLLPVQTTGFGTSEDLNSSSLLLGDSGLGMSFSQPSTSGPTASDELSGTYVENGEYYCV